MPTYRSITTSLVSQFDLLTIPEYPPPQIPKDPFCPVPTLINPTDAVVSVYIPTYPSSQFWISYSISPPYPPKALYYFKLFLNGSCVVSWGCSRENEYKGKTMFALYDSGKRRNGLPEFERRVLCFGSGDGDSNNSLEDVMEMRVYRSRGRKRIQPVLESFLEPFSGINQRISKKTNEAGINLANAGIPGDGRLPKYYKYMLIDPLDRPFATFRYFYRNWSKAIRLLKTFLNLWLICLDQLQAIGVISPGSSTNTSIHSQESCSSLAPVTLQRTSLSDLPANTASSPLDIKSQIPLSHIVPCISNSPISTALPELQATAPRSEDIRPTSRLISVKQSQPLVSALKTRKSPRSPSISVASSFASLLRRSPSPVKTVSAYRFFNEQPAQAPRASSIKVLKDVLNSAVKRRAKAESETEDTSETHWERTARFNRLRCAEMTEMGASIRKSSNLRLESLGGNDILSSSSSREKGNGN